MFRQWIVCGPWILCVVLLQLGCQDPLAASKSEGKAIGGDDISPEFIAVDDGFVYFTEGGGSDSTKGVKRTGVGETSSTLLATADFDPSLLVTDGTHVFWVERDGTISSVLKRVSVTGENAEVLDDSRVEISALTIDERNVYYSDKSNGSIYSVPLEGGPPVLLYTAANTALVALAADGEYVYFALAFDAPNGRILRLPRQGNAEPTIIVSGLGTPFALAVDENEICWREVQNGIIGCAPKEGGSPATTLATQQSFLPLHGYMLAMDEQSLFYPSGKEIRRLDRSTGQTPQVVARAGQFVISIGGLAIDDTNVYWSELSSLRQIEKTHVSAASTNDSDVPDGDVNVNCSTDYNGNYFGKFAYEYDTGDPSNPPLTTVTGAVTLNLTFKCLATAAGSTVLTITHAVADNPYFGCQLDGCKPSFGSVATLPASPPTTPSNPSQSGQGILVFFPNGTSIGTTNSVGALNVTGGGRILSNSLDPAFQNSTWVAGSNGGPSFPPERQDGTPVVRWKSWQLNHSAL